MKRRDIIKRIAKEAKTQGAAFTFQREGGKHSIYDLNGILLSIPRHKDINELTARDIFIDTEDVLGKDWWR